MKVLCIPVVLMAVVVGGCGGGGARASQAEPDPVAYQIVGVDLVPDQVPERADIRIVPEDPMNPRDVSVVILEQQLFASCNASSAHQYSIATMAGVGVGRRHYKISGQPANVTIDESTGVVTLNPGSDCVPGDYLFVHSVDAESNHKLAPSNTLQVRMAIN